MNAANKMTVITGLIALAAGLAIGVGATELKNETEATSKGTGAAISQPSPAVLSSANATAQTWDPFQDIRDMQMQMDRLFNKMSSEFRSEPQFSGVEQNPAYSLSLNVRDLKDRFVVHAFLPDTKVSDVNVTLDKQMLKVQVSNQQTQKSDKNDVAMSVAQWGQYEQIIQLPTAVKADQMKIERKDHELIITLPKE